MSLTHSIATAASRVTSEDRVVVLERGSSLVVLVADGAGGRPGGAAASASIESAVQSAAGAGIDAFDVRAWSALLRQIDAELATTMAGESTAVVLAVEGDAIAGVSAGDSEAWLVGGPEIERVTAKQGRARIGSGRAQPVPFFARMRDRVLLVASDGLFGQVSRNVIADTVVTGAVALMAERLLESARLSTGGFADDISVVVIASSGENGH